MLETVLSAKMMYFCKTNLTKKKKQIGISLHIAQVMFMDGNKVYTGPVLNTEKKK